MSNLYVTADAIGGWSGGSQVTFHESQALSSLGPCEVWDRDKLSCNGVYPLPNDLHNANPNYKDPWCYDSVAHINLEYEKGRTWKTWKLAHFYAGTFSKTVDIVKNNGCKVSYTAAAHDVEASRREHEKLGIPYSYPHITEPDLWKRYVQGYLEADVLICPSQHSAKVMQGFGFNGRIEIIPHGVNLPDSISPLPERFTVGYLGAIGPDKGLHYLIEAWGKLGYKDAVLNIAGRDSTHPFVSQMIQQWGGNANFNLMGWVENVSDFYNSCSIYCQPSVTEGFGIEVLEAMSHNRAVLCSRGVGASDLIPEMTGLLFNPCDSNAVAEKIDFCRKYDYHVLHGPYSGAPRAKVKDFTWDKIRQRYIDLWKGLIS